VRIKTYILIIVFGFIQSDLVSQEDLNLDDMNLYGDVKSITETWTAVDSNYDDCWSNDENNLKKYLFDEKGGLIEFYTSEPDIIYKDVIYKYEYDKNGQIIYKTAQNTESDTILYTYKYFYNEDGNLTEETIKKEATNKVDTFDSYKYDSKGNVTEIIYAHTSDYRNNEVMYRSKVTYEYNENRNKSFIYMYDFQAEMYHDSSRYYYDDNLRLVREEILNGQDKIEYVVNYDYDKFGNLTKYDGGLLSSYKYDEKNNWIEKVTLAKGYKGTTKRVIEYYK